MSEKEIVEEIKEIMKITGERDPLKALKKARKMLMGRRTVHSRIVGTLAGVLDAINIIEEIKKTEYERGYEAGYKYALSREPEQVRRKKQEMELKLLEKVDKLFDRLDVFLDFFAKSQVSQVKQQIRESVKVKPTFKVSIEG